jgi:hypothetical protein
MIADDDVITGDQVGHFGRCFPGCCSSDHNERQEILQRPIEAQGAVGVCLVPTTDQQEEQQTGQRIEIARANTR